VVTVAEEAASAKPWVDEYRKAAERYRDAAKAVLSSLAAVGALGVAGLGLASLTKVDEPGRLVLAVIALAVALIGIGLAIYQSARVMAPSTVTGNSLAAEEAKAENARNYLGEVLRDKNALDGLATSYAELNQKRQAAFRQRNEKVLAAYQDQSGDPAIARAAQLAQAELALYNQALETAVARGAFLEVKSRLSIGKQLGAAAIAAIGACGFALAVAWPSHPAKADLRGANLQSADLSGAALVSANFAAMELNGVNLREADLRKADFSKAKLNGVDFTGAHLDDAKFDGATWTGVTCPDGTHSDEAGKTCTAHLGGDD
jgi:uncharacterized protein YjbI with pentapeptide repeats